jgi:hypothetical protein
MTIFLLMKREPEYTGIGGYLNSSFRSDVSDAQLLMAGETLGLTYSELFLWVNSRYARHFMDSEPHSVSQYVEELKYKIPALTEESGIKIRHYCGQSEEYCACYRMQGERSRDGGTL